MPGRALSCAGAKFSTARMPARLTRSNTFWAAGAGTARMAMLTLSRRATSDSNPMSRTGTPPRERPPTLPLSLSNKATIWNPPALKPA